MRTVSADLARRYEAAGWWTRDTIGDMLARGLAAAPDLEFRVHSEARPWTGTFRDVELVARRLAAFLIPLLDSKPVNLTDGWDPGRVLALMETYGVVPGGGAPYYITSLLDHPGCTREHTAMVKYAGMGGAPVPVALSQRLEERGVTVFRSYGSTEHPSVTASATTAPASKRIYTDGEALDGVEIRLTTDGEILSRGPDLCLGYTDDALTARVFDADGYLTVVDRKSDVIIRGGENVSAVEVEELLLTMDGVTEVAVVAVPDARLGEHAAAVLRVRPGYQVPDLAQVRGHLERAGLARQKWPEEIHAVDDFPRTASGKIQKFRLRQNLRQSLPA